MARYALRFPGELRNDPEPLARGSVRRRAEVDRAKPAIN